MVLQRACASRMACANPNWHTNCYPRNKMRTTVHSICNVKQNWKMQTKTHKKVEKSGSCPVSGISLQFLIIKVFFNYLTRVLLHCFNLLDHWLNLKNASNQSGPRYQDFSILHFPRFSKETPSISSRQSPFQVHSNRIEEAGTRCLFLWQITTGFCNN